MDKSKMKTGVGNYLTQALFLEMGYKASAIYTLKDEDYEYEGKVYPSLKRLYLEMEDVVEYEFANKHLCGWEHWQRIANNGLLKPHVEKWRTELELKLRSKAFKEILTRTKTEQGMVANKWIADKGWIKKEAGRPTKADIEREAAYQANVLEEYGDDLKRMEH